MASGSFNLTRTGSTSPDIIFVCSWSSVSNGSAANSSTVTVNIIASKSSSSNVDTYGTYTASATVNGTTQSVSSTNFTLRPGSSITLLTKSYTVPHNSDGSKSTTITANVGGNIMYGNGSDTVTLDNIPRYATVNQSLNDRTETSIIMNWSSDSTIDYVWYSTNNGSSWTGISIPDSTSGSYTINGLTANTTYYIKTRVRRKESQLTTDSSSLSVSTYAYPYCNNMPNFTIGNKLTLGFFNPLGRNITVNILGDDNSQISNDVTSGTSISGYNGTVVVNKLYASIPNSKSGTYKVKVTYGEHISTEIGGTYIINKNDCLPSIGTLTYADTNSTCTAITGNNQLIIRNQSTVLFTASSLTGNKSATIASCQLTVNANNYSMTLSGSTATVSNIVIDSASDVAATFTLTDSRGLTASKNLNITMLDWILPTAIITLQRQHNFYSESDINVNAEYSSLDNKNTITIQCRYKKVTDSSYGSYVTLQDNVTSVLTLDNNYEWDVQVLVTDKFGSTTYNLTLSQGMPIIYFDRLLRSTGFNCFPKYEKSVEINGINIIRSVMTRSLSSSITNLSVNTYTIIPFDLDTSTDDGRLTTTQDGGIKIGSGINQILVSGQMALKALNNSGNRYVIIVKNSYSAANTLAWGCGNFQIGDTESITISPQLENVSENDVIYLYYYTSNSADQIYGNAYDVETFLTVDTVN